MRTFDRKKTLAYAVNFIFDTPCNFMMGNKMYKYINTVWDTLEDGSSTAVAVLYDYSKGQYISLCIDDVKVGSKQITIC
jgi:hypothetical protein